MSFVLIAANSARMAAQTACQIGLKPLVIDLYGDLDTRRYAHDYCQIPSLASAHLLPAVDFFCQHYAVSEGFYGSGFEHHPDSLVALSQRLALSGNTPDTFARVQNKAEFFAVLAELKLPHPEISFTPPETGSDWLSKPWQGLGGMGIRQYLAGSADTGVYWQKFQAGQAGSVLFLADGNAAEALGFNTQWTIPLDAESFIFSGITNHSPLTRRQETRVAGWLNALTLAFNLRGLNSLDFIRHDDELFILEINPRLSASMQLYAPDLLHCHRLAKLRQRPAPKQGFMGYQIVYARADTPIPEGFAWPESAQDLPPPNTICRKNQPICSIIAQCASADGVYQQLSLDQNNLLNQLKKQGLFP